MLAWGAPLGQTGAAMRLLLPDLRTLPPFDLSIEETVGGRRELRPAP